MIKSYQLFIFALSFFVLFLISFVTSKLVNSKQPAAFIDEIFHIPQAQAYCRDNWKRWDKKITTLPGLYIISYVFHRSISLIFEVPCNVESLRATNIVATLLIFVLSFKIRRKVLVESVGCSVLSALNTALLPPLYLFTFFYYTDVWSTASVLFVYYLYLTERKFLGGLVSVCAVLMRQTNVIWVGFLVIIGSWSAAIGKRNERKTFQGQVKALLEYLPFCKGKSQNDQDTLLQVVIRIISKSFPYLITCFLFVCFVFVNGGIVVGDKQAHQPVFHFMQNLYFLLFAGFFGLPFFLSQVLNSKKSVLKNLNLKFVLLCGFCTVVSEVNKLEHPYLLADNRHLAFYVWRKVLGHEFIRYLIVPLYVMSGVILLGLLQTCSTIFVIGLALCTFMNLTPQYLFEVRYFILPYLMCRLHFQGSKWTLLCETLYYLALNTAMISLFCRKTFTWDSEPGVLQRIIW